MAIANIGLIVTRIGSGTQFHDERNEIALIFLILIGAFSAVSFWLIQAQPLIGGQAKAFNQSFF